MEFYTEFNRPETKGQEFGENKLPQYEWQVNKKGEKELVETGCKDFDEITETYRNYTDVNKIIEAYTKNPIEAEKMFAMQEGMYADFTNTPQTMLELQNQIMKAEQKFNSLDTETKEMFDNSIDKFKAAIYDGTMKEKLDKRFNKKVEQTQQAEQTETTQQTGGEN